MKVVVEAIGEVCGNLSPIVGRDILKCVVDRVLDLENARVALQGTNAGVVSACVCDFLRIGREPLFARETVQLLSPTPKPSMQEILSTPRFASISAAKS